MTLQRLQQLIAQLVEIGTIKSVDEAAGTYIVDIDGTNTAPLHALTARAGTNKSGELYEPGEQVLVLSVGGDLRQGIIVGAINSNTHPHPTQSKHLKTFTFEDGAYVSYNKNTSVMTVTTPGTINVSADVVNVTGDRGDVVVDGVSLVNHTHPQTNGNDYGGNTDTNKPNKV